MTFWQRSELAEIHRGIQEIERRVSKVLNNERKTSNTSEKGLGFRQRDILHYVRGSADGISLARLVLTFDKNVRDPVRTLVRRGLLLTVTRENKTWVYST